MKTRRTKPRLSVQRSERERRRMRRASRTTSRKAARCDSRRRSPRNARPTAASCSSSDAARPPPRRRLQLSRPPLLSKAGQTRVPPTSSASLTSSLSLPNENTTVYSTITSTWSYCYIYATKNIQIHSILYSVGLVLAYSLVNLRNMLNFILKLIARTYSW